MPSLSRIELFKKAMSIEKERAALQGRLDQLLARLEHIKRALFSSLSGVTVPIAAKAAAVTRKAAPAAPKGRARRGELRQRILDALAVAGKAGMRVRDLAATIGAKPEALHSWFQFARKRIRAIRKAGKGRYRLAGAVPEAAPAPKRAQKTKPAPAARKSKGNQRGQLTNAIHAELKAAGKAGAHVGDMAKKLGINPRNLFVWFATTGKKFKAVKKHGPGHYRLQH